MSDLRIVRRFSPTLRQFQQNDAFVRAVVGPYGSGKSSACVMECLRRAGRQRPGPDGVRRTRGLIARNTYRELEDTTRVTFEEWVPEQLGRFVESDFSWVGRWFDGEHLVETEILFRAFDEAKDVKKLKSLELTFGWLNEASEMRSEIFDTAQARVGRYPAKVNGGASWFGLWLDTNAWHTGHWGYKLFTQRKGLRPQDQEGFKLFEQPSGLSPEVENADNLPSGYYDRLCAGKDSEWIDQYVRARYPNAAKGSIWGKAIAVLSARGGLAEFRHPNDGVFTIWDLGVSDSTAIWFFRVGKNGLPDVIDYYENSGEGASHYFGVIDGKPYEYVQHFLPHDGRHRSWQTGVSTLDQFISHFGAGLVSIAPELSLRDGISAARWLLEQPMRIHPRCAPGVEALTEYRYDWDEDAKAFSTRPLHDWSSHGADAFRYLACVVKESELMATKPAIVPPPPPTRALESFTIDELWTMRRPKSSGRV